MSSRERCCHTSRGPSTRISVTSGGTGRSRDNGLVTFDSGGRATSDDAVTARAGHARLRGDVVDGRYTVTVVSRHGQQTTTQHVTIAGQPVENGGLAWAVTGDAAATGLAPASCRAFTVPCRRSCRTEPTA